MKLEVKNIVKSFSGTEILHEVSFEVVSSRAMGFLGRNGAGKTTTIRCLMDVFKQESGEFYLDGQLFNPSEYKIGYLPEERGMYQKSTLLDQLVYFGMLRGGSRKEAKESASYWIDRFGLSKYKNKFLETLSKGNQQKIQIAQAFLNNPDIIILDEPFSGLDPVNAQIFKDIIREFVDQGKLIIFSSHQMSYVEEVCDDVTLIHNGSIELTGSLQSIKRDFGENKAIIKVENHSTEELVERLMEYQPEVTKSGIILTRPTGVEHNDLLTMLLNQGYEISKFGYYEPSLHDIFVRTVGENNA